MKNKFFFADKERNQNSDQQELGYNKFSIRLEELMKKQPQSGDEITFGSSILSYLYGIQNYSTFYSKNRHFKKNPINKSCEEFNLTLYSVI